MNRERHLKGAIGSCVVGRRELLRAIPVLYLARGLQGASPETRPSGPRILSFGIVADVQYAEKETSGARRYRAGVERLGQCVDDWRGQDLAFVIQVGDLIDGGETPGATREDLQRVLRVLEPLGENMRHVVGNHCLTLPRDELLRCLKLERAYYCFDEGPWRFIILDTMDVSVMGWPQDSPPYKKAQAYLEDHPEAARYNGAVGAQQRKWLRARLEEARAAGRRVITFSHHPLVKEAAPESLLAWNHRQVNRILEESGCVVTHFAGHHHGGGYGQRGGIHHVTLEGMVEAPEGRNAYGVVEVYEDRVVINGEGALASRVLPIPVQMKSTSTASGTRPASRPRARSRRTASRPASP